LKEATKEILGACVSMGVTAEGKDPREVQREIDGGKYDEAFDKS
jgi:large subunit ribosomal protein L11